ncbi:permease prefix domain 1-containing protein [Cryptosporangium aurantiacum]|uniref:Uncharacterized protein n=1 Tax=Cryptosporangium aurantiacum TaxID=134849 RepID=A0A1M7TWQ8_9ACTN|nr:permease prefix domain 1-containing protein [Cryptosporangium aurantiacum]SHN75142.1 hypothetical protein SAMN05443668_107228 [Cryptosporangium aurantiacum]
MSTDLVDRYVFTVLRRVPERQRADIDRELRASIADAVDARVENGEPPEAATEATLLELGDPDRLADGYADRPRVLIGPELYDIWRRLLLMLFSIVLPIVVTVVVIVTVLEDPAIGPAIGAGIGALMTTGAHLAFWTTLVFAILERTGVARRDLGAEWTLAHLPKYEPASLSLGQLALTVLWPVLLIAGLVLQQFTFTDVPVLDPDNWTFWWPFLIGVLVLEIVYAVWLHRRGAWTHAVTAANAVLAVLLTGPVVWLLATDRFFNPEFVAGLDWGTEDPLAWLRGIVIVVAIVGAVYDVVDVAIRAERARRGLATPVAGTGNLTVTAG